MSIHRGIVKTKAFYSVVPGTPERRCRDGRVIVKVDALKRRRVCGRRWHRRRQCDARDGDDHNEAAFENVPAPASESHPDEVSSGNKIWIFY